MKGETTLNLGKQGGVGIAAEAQKIIAAFAKEMTTYGEICWKQKGT